MKNHRILLILSLLLLASISTASAGKVGPDCTYNGKKLYGKIQYVDSFPDLKIKFVDAFPDLEVEKVSAFPDKCGKWKFVKSFPDIKIKFVKSFPDIKIKYVSSFPGVP